MRHQQHPKDLRPTKATLIFRAMGWGWLGLWIIQSTPLFGGTVYRCGDEYSITLTCSHGTSAEIKTQTELPKRSDAQTSPATQDQREAEALEKKRLRQDSPAIQVMPRRVEPMASEPPDPNLGPSNTHKRRPQSPYFTAKDPSAPRKKKSSTQVLPPAAN